MPEESVNSWIPFPDKEKTIPPIVGRLGISPAPGPNSEPRFPEFLRGSEVWLRSHLLLSCHRVAVVVASVGPSLLRRWIYYFDDEVSAESSRHRVDQTC